jgi:hypothetical protein
VTVFTQTSEPDLVKAIKALPVGTKYRVPGRSEVFTRTP